MPTIHKSAKSSPPVTCCLVKNTNDLPRIAREAHYIATTGRPGPVLIDVPKDISQGPFTGDLNAEMDLPGYHPEESLKIDKKSVQDAARIIMAAKRPVILAGHGAMIARADKELMAPGNRPIEIVDGGRVVKEILA